MSLPEETRLRFRDVFAARGLTVRDVSERTGLPYRSLQNYLSGRSDMPSATLLRIADLCSVSTDYLLKGFTYIDAEQLTIAFSSAEMIERSNQNDPIEINDAVRFVENRSRTATSRFSERAEKFLIALMAVERAGILGKQPRTRRARAMLKARSQGSEQGPGRGSNDS